MAARKKPPPPAEHWYVKALFWRRGECSACQSGPFSSRQVAEEFILELAGNHPQFVGATVQDGRWHESNRMKASKATDQPLMHASTIQSTARNLHATSMLHLDTPEMQQSFMQWARHRVCDYCGSLHQAAFENCRNCGASLPAAREPKHPAYK